MAMGQPAQRAFTVTPSDTKDLVHTASFIRVGGAGNIKIRTLTLEDITIENVLAGETLWLACLRVFDTGTTATKITGFQ